MFGRKVVLLSSLGVTQAVLRLREATMPAGLFANWGKKDFVARVENNGEFELWRRRSWTKNDFAPRLCGRIVATGGGSRITATFGSSRLVQLFMKLWLAFVGVAGGLAIVIGIVHWMGGQADFQPAGFVILAALFAYGLLLPRLGYMFSAGDEEEILGFLQKELQACPDAIMPIEPM